MAGPAGALGRGSGRVALYFREDAAVLGLSSLSGAHMEYAIDLCRMLRENDREDVLFLVGGTIPDDDAARLKSVGVSEVFGPGARTADIIAYIGGEAASVVEEREAELKVTVLWDMNVLMPLAVRLTQVVLMSYSGNVVDRAGSGVSGVLVELSQGGAHH